MQPLLFTPSLLPSILAVLSAFNMGAVAFAVMALGRVDAAGRQRWWNQWCTAATRRTLGLSALIACSGLIIGTSAGSAVAALAGAGAGGVLALITGRGVQRFIVHETRQRQQEMRHWTVRKPAEQRLAHQAALRQRELDEVQALALRKLMDPHFLFNALNGIMHDMMTREWSRAMRHLRAFNRLAQGQIQSGQRGWITLSDEWSGLADYLDLEVRRLGRDIRWNMVPLPHELGDLRIPALLVQPLVENALWHGLGGTAHAGPGLVRIAAEPAGPAHLRISVFNSHCGEEAGEHRLARPQDEGDRRRHASDLIQQRLRLLDRGGESGLSIASTAAGTNATVVVPCSSIW